MTTTKIRRHPGIVEQVRVALSPHYRLATFIGALLGAIVPLSTFTVLHGELGSDWYDIRWLVVAGGLLYSATTVYRWGKLAFQSGWKAIGFTVLIEGVMTLSTSTWLAATALAYLCVINAIGTGVTLARGIAVEAPPPEHVIEVGATLRLSDSPAARARRRDRVSRAAKRPEVVS